MERKYIELKKGGKAMCKCVRCGEEFDLGYAKRSIGKSYGSGTYDDYYPEGNVCVACAIEEISADYNEGAEIRELMGLEWDD